MAMHPDLGRLRLVERPPSVRVWGLELLQEQKGRIETPLGAIVDLIVDGRLSGGVPTSDPAVDVYPNTHYNGIYVPPNVATTLSFIPGAGPPPVTMLNNSNHETIYGVEILVVPPGPATPGYTVPATSNPTGEHPGYSVGEGIYPSIPAGRLMIEMFLPSNHNLEVGNTIIVALNSTSPGRVLYLPCYNTISGIEYVPACRRQFTTITDLEPIFRFSYTPLNEVASPTVSQLGVFVTAKLLVGRNIGYEVGLIHPELRAYAEDAIS